MSGTYHGTNDVGVPVYEIVEGGQRPMVDADGRIRCRKCDGTMRPLRMHFGFDEAGKVEYGALACRSLECGQIHCILVVRLYGTTRTEVASVLANYKMTSTGEPEPDA